MALDEIKAPRLLWAICAALVFLGFYQLSSGLKTLLHTTEPGLLSITKIGAGLFFIVSGIALSFLTFAGRVLVSIASGAGIVLLVFRLDWIRFLFTMDEFPQQSAVAVNNIVWGAVVCAVIIGYVMCSPGVVKAFREEKLRRSASIKKKKFL